MMTQVSRLSVRDEFRYSPHFVHHALAVDGDSLADWIAREQNDDRMASLTPALNGLADDAEQLECRRLVRAMAERSIVPLLTCPDDLDLDCTVVVAEQTVRDDSVTWRRFGTAQSDSIRTLDRSVSWFAISSSLTFDRVEFEAGVEGFLRRIP